MSGDFRDTTAARDLCRAARSQGDGMVDAGEVLDALDHAARTADAREAVAAAERLRAAVRTALGEGSWLMPDNELIEALHVLGGERS